MVRVFCDFDGTICLKDLGEHFFRKFAGEQAEASVKRLLSGEITMQESLTEMCKAIPAISKRKFYDFVDGFSIDPKFKEFEDFCRRNEIPVTVLSDGLDLYVKRVLLNAGLDQLQSFANRAEIKRSWTKEKLTVSFPFTDSECNLCGNCKRNHMLNLSADDDIIIYVGDGFSDKCPVRYADFVFAKGHLIKYCQNQNITFFEFNDFGDVQSRLEKIIQRKHIRHRQEAAMARREIFMQG
jgi:2-hydroxy-3-keto-5-methylthiopentenyl-1-phosphate phosphatase